MTTTHFAVYERLDHSHQTDDSLVLDHDTRVKGRFKAISQNGIEVRVFLERGKTLQVGEALKTECGKYIQIIGATEALTEARCDHWDTFSKACYHLGNRHVKVQVGDRRLYIKPDYVLEDMLVGLGLSIHSRCEVFIPEDGAYKGGHHHH